MQSVVTWPTIPAMVRDAARRFGAAEAVVDGPRRVSYPDLSDAVTDAARALLACGIERGDRVALWAPNSLEWIVAALGITTAVPISMRDVTSPTTVAAVSASKSSGTCGIQTDARPASSAHLASARRRSTFVA